MNVSILFIGDIVGRPGRDLMTALMPRLREEYDGIVANGENSAGGAGITGEIASYFFSLGVDVITGGNHSWKNREVLEVIDREPRLLRPLNYHPAAETPGRGYGAFDLDCGAKLGVVNLMGRVFMNPMECPFRAGREAVDMLRRETKLILVDMHAEATSEKRAMGYYLDGSVTAVVGTHTHVPTADEEILQNGTAYITDVGMTGPYDSIIGVRSDIIVHNFLTGMPVRHEVAKGDPRLAAVAIEADSATGKATQVRRIWLTASGESR